MKTIPKNTATRQRRGGVTFSNAIARLIDTKKNKTRLGYLRDRAKRSTTVTTALKNGTGHQVDRDKRATTVTTAYSGSAC